MSDILQFEGINDKGYGFSPKLVYQDRRLTPQAKGLYGYFASYAGSGTQAFPSRSKILYDMNMSKDAYYKHFRLLKQYGYIKAEQQHEGGRLSRNIYTLMQVVPVADRQQVENSRSTGECPKSKTVFSSKQDTDIQYMGKQYPEKQDTNKSNSLKSNISQKYQSCQSKTDVTGKENVETVDNVDKYVDIVKSNIDYEKLKITHSVDMGMVDEFVGVILDAIFTHTPTVRINSEDKSRAIVKSVLLKLNYWNIVSVLDKYKALTTRISNKHGYVLTMLYNSHLEAATGEYNQTKAVTSTGEVRPTGERKQSQQKPKNRFINYTQSYTDADIAEVERMDREYWAKQEPITEEFLKEYRERRKQQGTNKQNRFINYDQREWDFDELKRLEREQRDKWDTEGSSLEELMERRRQRQLQECAEVNFVYQ